MLTIDLPTDKVIMGPENHGPNQYVEIVIAASPALTSHDLGVNMGG